MFGCSDLFGYLQDISPRNRSYMDCCKTNQTGFLEEPAARAQWKQVLRYLYDDWFKDDSNQVNDPISPT